MTTYKELLALADAATPGPWTDDGTEVWRPSDIAVLDIAATERTRDAAFIAAANPTAVRALVREVLALRDMVERVDKVRRWVVPNGYAGGPEGDKTTAVMLRLDDLREALGGPA